MKPTKLSLTIEPVNGVWGLDRLAHDVHRAVVEGKDFHRRNQFKVRYDHEAGELRYMGEVIAKRTALGAWRFNMREFDTKPRVIRPLLRMIARSFGRPQLIVHNGKFMCDGNTLSPGEWF